MANEIATKNNLKRTKRLLDRLKRVDKKLDKIVAEIATTNQTSNFYWRKLNTQIRKTYEEARKISAAWATPNIPIAYRAEVQKTLASIKSKKVRVKDISYKKFVNSNLAKQSIGALLEETVSTFSSAYLSGQKTMIRLSRLTQQVNLAEKEINRQIAEGFIEKGSVTGSTKNLQQELLKKSLDGKHITIINKKGVTERWQVSTYSELVARTKLQETSTQAVVNTTAAVGGDLVQVSAHNTLTTYDAQFESKIYSLSGNSKKFPVAFDLPPFHPNCLHTISTVFVETLEQQGNLKQFEEFSKGETARPPNRPGFVPVSERELTK